MSFDWKHHFLNNFIRLDIIVKAKSEEEIQELIE